MHRTDARDPSLDPNALTLDAFAQCLRDTGLVRRLLELARDEDLGVPAHDWTGELMFDPGERRLVVLRSRDAGVAAGLAFLPDMIEVFAEPGQIECRLLLSDGAELAPGVTLATLMGDARAIVRLERPMLNLLSRMSGIATLTRRYASLVEGTTARVCDTRKTTPGLRVFEKYAVRCGGGATHRMGLHDAVLVKDNHLAGLSPEEIATRLTQAAHRLGERGARVWFVQVEVDSLEQFRRVLEVPAGVVDMVLLDNMDPTRLRQAVAMRDERGSAVLLEASGGVNLETIRQIAETGVDRVSVGSLTHQARSLDLGLDAE